MTILVVKWFQTITKGVLLKCNPILFPNHFNFEIKVSCNGRRFHSNKTFSFHLVTYSVPLSVFKFRC